MLPVEEEPEPELPLPQQVASMASTHHVHGALPGWEPQSAEVPPSVWSIQES